MIELLIVVVIIGILASVALPSFIAAQDRARNVKAVSMIAVVRQALENYGADKNGNFPSNPNFVTAAGLGANNYLPGNQLPVAPWSKTPQANRIEPLIAPAVYAEYVTNSTWVPPKAGDLLVPATAGTAVAQPSMISHFGAIASDCDNAGDPTIYVINVVGKRNGRCMLAGYKSNNGP